MTGYSSKSVRAARPESGSAFHLSWVFALSNLFLWMVFPCTVSFMNFLDQLTKDQRDLLVALPYRIGLYVSQSDDTGGDESDEAERQSLDAIITGYSQEVFGAETAQYVIGETVLRKSEWPAWEQDLDAIEHDCFKAVDILAGAVDEKEVSAFKKSLIEIAENVALAFREYGASTSFFDKIRMRSDFGKSKKDAAKAGVAAKDWDQFINISVAERKALRHVAQALGLTYV